MTLSDKPLKWLYPQNRIVRYAVVFEPFETEGLEYVKQGCGAMWDDKSPVKVFDTQEEAQKEADKWNTGQVVQYG